MTWLNLARVGKWRDMHGRLVDLTIGRLSQIVQNFDPGKGMAPLVFGHPKTEAPAYGWFDKLRMVGDVLQGRLTETAEGIKDLVAKGHYKYLSMSISKDNRLQHVGLLGAVPPAIDGLGEVSLSAGWAINIPFAEGSGDDGPGDPPKPKETDMTLEEALKKIAELEAKLADLQKAVETLTGEKTEAEKAKEAAEAEFSAYKEKQVKADREARFSALVKSGKALPAEKDRVMAFATTLSASENQISFAAEGGKIENISQEEAYWRDLESRKAMDMTAEFATGDRYRGSDPKPTDRSNINDYA